MKTFAMVSLNPPTFAAFQQVVYRFVHQRPRPAVASLLKERAQLVHRTGPEFAFFILGEEF